MLNKRDNRKHFIDKVRFLKLLSALKVNKLNNVDCVRMEGKSDNYSLKIAAFNLKSNRKIEVELYEGGRYLLELLPSQIQAAEREIYPVIQNEIRRDAELMKEAEAEERYGVAGALYNSWY